MRAPRALSLGPISIMSLRPMDLPHQLAFLIRASLICWTHKDLISIYPLLTTLNGVVISITKDSQPQNGIIDQYVQLIKGGVISGNNYGQFGNWLAGSFGTYTYGSSNGLWGLSLTPSDVSSSTFGVALSAKCNLITFRGQSEFPPFPFNTLEGQVAPQNSFISIQLVDLNPIIDNNV